MTCFICLPELCCSKHQALKELASESEEFAQESAKFWDEEFDETSELISSQVFQEKDY